MELRPCNSSVCPKGGTIADITAGDCLQLQQAMTDGQGGKGTGKHLYYLLLRDTGVLGAGVPANLQAMLMPGQLSVEELVDRHEIADAGIRGVFIEYFPDRQPVMDYASLSGLVRQLCGLFWRDLEVHHPGIGSLALAPEVAYAWKQRIKTYRGADGALRGRTTAPDVMTAVRGFYADLQMWAVEDPARWAAWVAPNPIRATDTDLTKSKLHRKARTDERTRQRLPLLPQLVNALDERRRAAAARLQAVRDQPPGSTVDFAGQRLHRAKLTSHAYAGQIYVTDADTNQRRNLSHEESDAFWSWAIVEILRHTGIRLEELTELTHHSLIAYKLPSTGEVVPMLQIAPSKVDRERLILISPELAEVIAEVIHRVRDGRAVLPLVCQYDIHEKKTSPPMPFLLQRAIGGQHRAIRRGTITGILARAVQAVGPTGSDNQPVRYSPHDFRRLFVTDAILNGLPPHIAQVICGHLDLSTTMTYKATYPTETIESYRAFIARRRASRPGQGVPRAHRREMGLLPRAFRETQSLHRHLRPRVWHPMQPRTRLRALPHAQTRPGATRQAARDPRQPPRPHRRSRTGRLARRD